MQQLQIKGFAGGIDHTAFTAFLPEIAAAGSIAGLFGVGTTFVLTKGTFGNNLSNGFANSWILSDPIVGVSRLAIFQEDISPYARGYYQDRLAFQTTGDLLIKSALIKPQDFVEYYRKVDTSFKMSLLDTNPGRSLLDVLNDNVVLCPRNNAAWSLIKPLSLEERHIVSVILEFGAAHHDPIVSTAGYIAQGLYLK